MPRNPPRLGDRLSQKKRDRLALIIPQTPNCFFSPNHSPAQLRSPPPTSSAYPRFLPDEPR
ncbi:hypothetical protein [Phormidium sp. CCY1219]|uniref:hypothetical protein n=1 Tax=Phormidium sp. CCY1219 TaxID=2886104 RepID=UPI002D1ECA56|nr:hypothetical protein [Phormidium sp. CCY1219]MEB3826949.1 hypothetical protein [Phormidium sp. CCY1219]